MGTARDPVVGSGSCPACTESVARCCFLLCDIAFSCENSLQAKGPQSWFDRRPEGNLVWQLSARWPVSRIARVDGQTATAWAQTATAWPAGETDVAKTHDSKY